MVKQYWSYKTSPSPCLHITDLSFAKRQSDRKSEHSSIRKRLRAFKVLSRIGKPPCSGGKYKYATSPASSSSDRHSGGVVCVVVVVNVVVTVTVGDDVAVTLGVELFE